MALLGIILHLAIWAPLVVIVTHIANEVFRSFRLPQLPIVGAKKGEWFPLMRARWRNFRNSKGALLGAYEEYGRKNQTCIFPVSASSELVMLPHAEMNWLVDQPDEFLSIDASMMDKVQLKYTFFNQGVIRKPVHHKLLHTHLTREVGNLVPCILDEISHAVDEVWGFDTHKWKDIAIYPTMRPVLGRTINRAFVGRPLCRHPAILENGIAFAQDMPFAATLLKLIWWPLRPFAAPFITLPNRIHTNRFKRVLMPEIKRRLKDYDARRANIEGKAIEPEPQDFLQWSVQQAKELGDPWYAKPDTLASRILLLNFAAIHSSSWAITHVLLDLISSDPIYIDELRAEIAGVLKAHDWQWNKRSLVDMLKLDSTMRESQRINTLATVATTRKVVKKGGITTPSGVHLPEGVTVVSYSLPIFEDPAIYPEPFTFKPFRFAEKRVTLEGIEKARQAWATTSTEYSPFGHGRHACPGRFFASADLRLLLAYIVTHYDFEMQNKRPENTWFGVTRIPPLRATIKIKRREKPIY